MKPLIPSTVSLLVGLAVGVYVGYHYHGRYGTTDAVKLMLEAAESSEAERAARATQAIELLQSGDTQAAVQTLSRPLAHYYSLYAHSADTETRRRICGMIEQLARTNTIVAQAITNEMSYSESYIPKK